MDRENLNLLKECAFYRLSDSFQFALYDKGEWKDCFVAVLLNDTVLLFRCEEFLDGSENSNRKMFSVLHTYDALAMYDNLKAKNVSEINEKLMEYVWNLLTTKGV